VITTHSKAEVSVVSGHALVSKHWHSIRTGRYPINLSSSLYSCRFPHRNSRPPAADRFDTLHTFPRQDIRQDIHLLCYHRSPISAVSHKWTSIKTYSSCSCEQYSLTAIPFLTWTYSSHPATRHLGISASLLSFSCGFLRSGCGYDWGLLCRCCFGREMPLLATGNTAFRVETGSRTTLGLMP
jgi:hypothetical protein